MSAYLFVAKLLEPFGVPPHEAATIAAGAECVRLGRRQEVRSALVRSDLLLLVERGRIAVLRLSESGVRLRLASYGVGEVFWPVPADNRIGCLSRVEACGHSTVLHVLHKQPLCELWMRYPALAHEGVRWLEQALAASCAAREEAAFWTVEERLAWLLATRAGDEGGMVVDSQEDLADGFGVARKQISRAVSVLKSAGAIETSPRRAGVRVPDAERLRNWRAGQAYGRHDTPGVTSADRSGGSDYAHPEPRATD